MFISVTPDLSCLPASFIHTSYQLPLNDFGDWKSLLGMISNTIKQWFPTHLNSRRTYLAKKIIRRTALQKFYTLPFSWI